MSSKRRHMSPLAIVVQSGGYALVAIAAAFLHGDDMPWWQNVILALVVGLVLTLVLAVPAYISTTYQITDDMITLRKGIFRRQLLQVTYARIQTVGHKQWFFMKPFGVEQLTIETAAHAGDEPEIQLTAVPMSVGRFVEQRQAAVQGQAHVRVVKEDAVSEGETAPAVAPDKTIWRRTLDFDALTLYAFTSLGFLPMALVLLTAWRYVDDLPVLKHWIGGLTARMGPLTLDGQHLVPLLLMLLGLLVVAGAISVAGTMMRYWRFTVQFDGQHLQVARGLLQTTTVSADTGRIQALQYKQNILRTLIGSGTASIILAAGSGSDEETSEMTLMPLLRHRAAWQQLAAVVDWAPTDLPPLQHFTTGYWQLIRNTILGSLVVIVPALIWLRPLGYLSLVLLPIAVAFGWFAARTRGLTLTDTAANVTTGSTLERTEVLFLRRRVQSLEVNQSWWMRRAGLCHVVWHLRQGNGDMSVTLRFIPLAVGQRVWAWYEQSTLN